MSSENRLLLREVKPFFTEAKGAIRQVVASAHQDHGALIEARNGALTQVPVASGINVDTRTGPMTLIDFGLGGKDSPVSPRIEGANDGRLVTVTFMNVDGQKHSARVRARGSVRYDDAEYNDSDAGEWVPVEFMWGGWKDGRIREIAADVESGLVIAGIFEQYAALLKGRESQTGRLDQARADLAGYVGEVPLAENIAALLPRNAE